jgi:hypothetical protein
LIRREGGNSLRKRPAEMGKKGGRITTEQQVTNEVSMETQDMPMELSMLQKELDEVEIVLAPDH